MKTVTFINIEFLRWNIPLRDAIANCILYYPSGSLRRNTFKALLLFFMLFARKIKKQDNEKLPIYLSDKLFFSWKVNSRGDARSYGIIFGDCQNLFVKFSNYDFECKQFFAEYNALKILESLRLEFDFPKLSNFITEKNSGYSILISSVIPSNFFLDKKKNLIDDWSFLDSFRGEAKYLSYIDFTNTLSSEFKLKDQNEKFLRTIKYSGERRFSRAHGDLGSTNIFIDSNSKGLCRKYFLTDWETFQDLAPFVLDYVSYWLGSKRKEELWNIGIVELYHQFERYFNHVNYDLIDFKMAIIKLAELKYDLAQIVINMDIEIGNK
ncbi:hypothetical protein N9O45_03395 [Planktomarina temperata]|nr:hypothetical protein [Planktomarina temperata]